MIRISREEAAYLRDNRMAYAVKMSSKTHKSKKKRHFAVEAPSVLMALEEFNKNKVITTYDGR